MAKKHTNLADKYDILPVDDIARLRAYDAAANAQPKPPPPEVGVGLTLRSALVLLFVAHAIAGLACWLANRK